MSMIDRIVKSKLERHMPKNEISRLIDRANGGTENERVQAYLQLSSVVVDLLHEPKPMRESYRSDILDCALSGMHDSSVSVQTAAKLAAAYQLAHMDSVGNGVSAEVRDKIIRLSEELEPFLRSRSKPAVGRSKSEAVRSVLDLNR
ncbi:MAG: hypothetical protein ABFD98_16495 [Syntrophobacteraceae bacterium]|nr:hypothetical protein [Desulfobacteraceae bacterium]